MKLLGKRQGFTLIELITVMAISAILLSLVAIPVIQSFNLTRAAEGFANAQGNARQLVARLERELSNAALVRSNQGTAGAIDIWLPGNTAASQLIRLNSAKLDFFKPAEGDPSNVFVDPVTGRTIFVNPDTGKGDPTLKAPKGQVNLPAAPGMTMVRYWIGLSRPFEPYSNPYLNLRRTDNSVWPINNGSENLYVLYRAEVQPRIWNSAQGRFVPNTTFFELDINGNPILDDPAFFSFDPTVAVNAAKQARIQAWKTAGTIISGSFRFDMIRPEYVLSNRQIVVDGGVPRVSPLIRFQPARMAVETTQQMASVGYGLESDNGAKVGAQSFLTALGGWSNSRITIWPSEPPGVFGPLNNSSGRPRGAWNQGNPFLQVENDPALGMVMRGSDGTLLFSVDNYRSLQSQKGAPAAAYPFSASIAAAARIAPWNSRFVPVTYDPKAGQVISSFDIREVGSNTSVPFELRTPGTPASQSVPVTNVDYSGVLPGPANLFNSDLLSADWASFTWSDWAQANVGINRRFNKLWDQLPALLPGVDNPRGRFAKRFIDLRLLQQPGGVPSPLDRRPAPAGSGFTRVQIVPGSEVVIGPDQRPGPSYGQQIRYSRVTQRPVGPNQYFINYVDQIEPDWSQYGLAANYDPANYNATDIVSSVLQAQYRAGYVEFNSNLGEPIPATGNIYVTYRFQFTEPADVLAVDYDSSKSMEIILTVQNYPQSSIPNPQSITVKGSAAVRNFLR